MRFFVRTKPKSKQSLVKQIDSSHLVVNVTSVPSKGEANEDVVAVLAKHFKVAKSKVVIIKGEKSREKIVEIIGV